MIKLGKALRTTRARTSFLLRPVRVVADRPGVTHYLSRRAEAKADWHPGVNHGVTAMQGTSDASGTTVSVADPI